MPMPLRKLLLLIVLALAALPADAGARAYLPPAGKVYAGITGGTEVDTFASQTGKHPPVFQFFTAWNQRTEWMFDSAREARSRLMLHVSTARGTREHVTPRGIARGQGDAYLLRLGRRMAEWGEPVYLRLMSEMNGHWNAYCAYSPSGRSRGPSHSTAMFRAAWRRTVIVLRGGPVAAINRRLGSLGLPPVATDEDELPRPQVAFLWVPQTAGAPDIRGNSPRAYWPGPAYVDWVGTDFYSKFPNFAGLERFYRAFGGKPFAFGEWAVWGRDDPAFVNRFFRWVRSHRRTRLVMYNQGVDPAGPFRLGRYPRSQHALARQLASPLFEAFTPEHR
jgi:hypothetical protein